MMSWFDCYFFYEKNKGIFHVYSTRSRSLDERHLPGFSEVFSLNDRDLSIDFSIWFIANKQLYSILVYMTANSFEMSLQTLEGLSICDIVDHHNALGSFEVRVVDGLKGFFSCCIPYLSPNNISVKFDVLGPELNPNGDLVSVRCMDTFR